MFLANEKEESSSSGSSGSRIVVVKWLWKSRKEVEIVNNEKSPLLVYVFTYDQGRLGSEGEWWCEVVRSDGGGGGRRRRKMVAEVGPKKEIV